MAEEARKIARALQRVLHRVSVLVKMAVDKVVQVVDPRLLAHILLSIRTSFLNSLEPEPCKW